MPRTTSHGSGTRPYRCRAGATRDTFDDLAWWQAANYLTVGQLYLRSNPLLRSPLRPEDVKERPAGIFGASATLTLVYAQLNRLAIGRGARSALVAAGPEALAALAAGSWLSGTYSERHPGASRDEHGMARLFRRYGRRIDAPGATGGPVGAQGGAAALLRQQASDALALSFQLVRNRPGSLAVCALPAGGATDALVEVDGPGQGALDPHQDGAVVPLVYLAARPRHPSAAAGSAPASAADAADEKLELLDLHGYRVWSVDEHEPCIAHASLEAALSAVHEWSQAAGAPVPAAGGAHGSIRPVIVLRTPFAWQGPATAEGYLAELAPAGQRLELDAPRQDPAQLAQLEEWLLSYGPDGLFDRCGSPSARLEALRPEPARRVCARIPGVTYL